MWTDDQMVRFAWTCINPALDEDSIRERLQQFREAEAQRFGEPVKVMENDDGNQ